jgi:hypothetical protein
LNKIERITFEKGVTPDELVDFTRAIARCRRSGSGAAARVEAELPAHPRRRIRRREKTDGIASDMATIRRLYNEAVAASESMGCHRHRGKPDVEARGGGGRSGRCGHAEPLRLVALTALRTTTTTRSRTW